MKEHPAFKRAKTLPEPWCTHFAKSVEEARAWKPFTNYRALSTRVLAVMSTRVEGTWAAYIDAVPGDSHENEFMKVLDHGNKLPEEVARVIFHFIPKEIPYAR